MININTLEIAGLTPAIIGMRNPMNSWDMSDTGYEDGKIKVGGADLGLMNKLCEAGSDHRKFMRMITVYVDITAPLYWWKEFDTYKVGTVANSCSTMHKVHAKEFTLSDFSFEHLEDDCIDVLLDLIEVLNVFRTKFIETKDKGCWWQLIQLLPSSYNQKRTVMLSYEVLTNIYNARKSHKLDEWRVDFCRWIEELPYSELITEH